MLKECYRVLAKGGKVRIVTPDLTKFVNLLADSADPEAQQFIEAKLRFHGWPATSVPAAYIFNHQVRDWDHQFLYNSATLRKSFELAGFKQITEHRVTEKTDPVFQDAELRTRNPGSIPYVVNKDRKSTRLNSSHRTISYAVFCLKKKKKKKKQKIKKKKRKIKKKYINLEK